MAGVFYCPDVTQMFVLCYNDVDGLFRPVSEGVLMVVSSELVEALLGAVLALLAMVEKLLTLARASASA